MTGPPMSDTQILRYVDQVTITPVAGTVGFHTFRANSIYDPDYTGVGHQPLNHDILADKYGSYVVTKSQVTATAAISGTTGGNGMIEFGIVNTPTSAPITTTPSTMAESR
eukprot:419284_1